MSWFRWVVAAFWALLVGLWLLYVAQHPAPAWVNLSAASLAPLVTALWIGLEAVNLWRRDEPGVRARLVALGVLVVVALAVHVIGIEHEVAEQYYADEGTYRHHADLINSGQFLQGGFHYPHLLYYIDAFVIWLASLDAERLLAVSERLFGVADWGTFCRLLARLVAAAMAALTVVPVFRLAHQLAGLFAGVVAGALITFSTVYNQGAHVNTADVPSAFFAALSFAAAGRLLRAESRRDYVLAGIYAGLAAGAKYPAGLVALAIVAVYLRWRLAPPHGRRRFSWSLLWAGIPSLLVFLLTTPGLALYPGESVFGSQGALFGLRQYSQGSWIGVVVPSNAAYYFALIARSFAWPAVLLGTAGLFLLRRQPRSEVLWLLPFPALYLALVTSMNIVVERNVYPALPEIAVFLGVGVGALRMRLDAGPGRDRPIRGMRLAAALAAVCLILPLVQVAAQDVAYARESTRQQASRWMHDNLIYGARILGENYTPNLSRRAFLVDRTRWIGSYSAEELAEKDYDFVVLASDAYSRFLRPEYHLEEGHAAIERHYREIFERLALVHELTPSRTRMGPRILIYKVGAGGKGAAGGAGGPRPPSGDRPPVAAPARAWPPRPLARVPSRDGRWCPPPGARGRGRRPRAGEHLRPRRRRGRSHRERGRARFRGGAREPGKVRSALLLPRQEPAGGSPHPQGVR